MKNGRKINYQKLSIAIVAIVLIIILAIFTPKLFSKNNGLKFNDFEKAAIYGYLENNLLDVSKIYQISGKSTYNELQIFQSKLKQALDSYFSTHPAESKVATSTALGMVDSDYVPASVDFHGIVVSDYEYDPSTDSFILSRGANANIAGIEADVNSINYSDKKASVQKVEKTSDDKYKVSFNIVNAIIGSDSVEASGEAIIFLQNGELVLDSCTLND